MAIFFLRNELDFTKAIPSIVYTFVVLQLFSNISFAGNRLMTNKNLSIYSSASSCLFFRNKKEIDANLSYNLS